MNTAPALQPPLNAAECWLEVEARAIALTPVFDGAVWMASVELKGDGHNRKRNLRSVSATASTTFQAVVNLVDKLGAEAKQQQLWLEEEAA